MPSESLTHVPLTPLPTDENSGFLVSSLLEEIKSRKAGNVSISSWSEHTLDSKGYKVLLQRLQWDSDKSLWGYVKHKLRCDYFPSSRRFIIRSPTPIHESVIKDVIGELQKQIASISNGDGQSADFAREIESDGLTTIDFEEPQFGSHDPDGQLRHAEANYPGVVLEIACSQKGKDLQYLADEYTLGSDGDIRVVIGINLECKRINKATLSVWEPRIVPNGIGEDELIALQIVNQGLYDEEGNPNKLANINLQLQQFATEDLSSTYGTLQDPIFISAQTLCDIVERAVKRATVRQEKTGWRKDSKPWVRKRAREKTPDEQLEERREKKFREDEESAHGKTEADDSSYKTGSSFGSE